MLTSFRNTVLFLFTILFGLCSYAQDMEDKTRIFLSKNIYFDFGEFDLNAIELAKLRSITDQVANDPNIIIKIHAHTDAIGSELDNESLSLKRGQAVKDYFMSNKIPDSLIAMNVFGESDPIATNATSNGRQQNRRATIEVVKLIPNVPMRTIGGKVTDTETGHPIKATVVIRGKTFRDSAQTDDQGYFENEAPLHNVIGIDVFATGYFFETRMMKVTPSNKLELLEFRLPRAKAGETAIIENLYFVGNKAVLLDKSLSILPRLLRFAQLNDTLNLEIGGHVNVPFNIQNSAYIGNANDFHQILSDKRAKLIYDYLTDNGIPEIRMSWKGYSNTKMLFPRPKSEEESQQNRRVEIKILEVIHSLKK